jgi:hypothetical protein
MDNYVGIISRHDKYQGHTAMLQDYGDFIYLRVEEYESGAGVTKITFDRQGNGDPSRQVDYPPQSDLDCYFVDWAQHIIRNMEVAA